MNATASPLSRKISRSIEFAIDDLDDLVRELTRLRGGLVDMQERGLDAMQIASSAGSGTPIDADVRKMADLAARVQLINELREIEATS